MMVFFVCPSPTHFVFYALRVGGAPVVVHKDVAPELLPSLRAPELPQVSESLTCFCWSSEVSSETELFLVFTVALFAVCLCCLADCIIIDSIAGLFHGCAL